MPAAQSPCFGHLLHDGVSNSLNDPLISPVLTKSKQISAHFHQSHSRAQRLQEDHRAVKCTKKLPRGTCSTRWGNTYELVAEIKKVVVIDRANLVTTPDEDKLLKLLVEAFEQRKSMTDGLSGE